MQKRSFLSLALFMLSWSKPSLSTNKTSQRSYFIAYCRNGSSEPRFAILQAPTNTIDKKEEFREPLRGWSSTIPGAHALHVLANKTKKCSEVAWEQVCQEIKELATADLSNLRPFICNKDFLDKYFQKKNEPTGNFGLCKNIYQLSSYQNVCSELQGYQKLHPIFEKLLKELKPTPKPSKSNDNNRHADSNNIPWAWIIGGGLGITLIGVSGYWFYTNSNKEAKFAEKKATL